MTSDNTDGHALPFHRCTGSDLFSFKNEDGVGDAIIAATDKYLSAFVAPVKKDGKLACFHCGELIDAFREAFGIGVAYRWGLCHGEAVCSGCGWPARGMHYPKNEDGSELWSLRNFFLAYHPDELSKEEVA